MFRNPMDSMYLHASARPMAPDMFWVPASKRSGTSESDMLQELSKRAFISPP